MAKAAQDMLGVDLGPALKNGTPTDVDAIKKLLGKLRTADPGAIVQHLRTTREIQKLCSIWDVHLSEDGAVRLRCGDCDPDFSPPRRKRFCPAVRRHLERGGGAEEPGGYPADLRRRPACRPRSVRKKDWSGPRSSCGRNGPTNGSCSRPRIFRRLRRHESTYSSIKMAVPTHEDTTSAPEGFRPIAGLAILLAGFLFLLTQKLGLGPGWGWGGGGAGPKAAPIAGSIDPHRTQPAASGRQPETQSRPLQITIDDTKYLVGDVPVESIDELVKMAIAVPKRAAAAGHGLRRPTARYMAEKKLTDALQAAKVDFMLEK